MFLHLRRVDSLQEIIDGYQPSLICIVETRMQKEEEIQISGYTFVYRNDRSANSGGILIGVRDNTKNIRWAKAFRCYSQTQRKKLE